MRSGDGFFGAVVLIGRYYMIQSLPFFDKISALLCLTSAMITIAIMMKHNEIVPICAAGISQVRVIKPIVYAAVVLTLGTAVVREIVLPLYLGDLLKDPGQYASGEGGEINAATDYHSRLRIQGGKSVYGEGRILTPTITLLDKSLMSYGKTLSAEEAIFQAAENDRPAGYLLKNVDKPKELLESPSLQIEGNPIIITPKDAAWLNPKDCFIVSRIPFSYIASNEAWTQYASTFEFIHAIRDRSLDIGKNIESTIHTRIVQPFLDLTLLFLGLPIILRRGDRNVFKAMGIVALVVFAFLLVQYSSLFLGRNSDMPVLGAWFPLMLFVPIAVFLYRKINET